MRPRGNGSQRRRLVASCCALAATLLVLLGLSGSVWGTFTAKAVNPGNQISGRADWKAPAVAATVVQKTEGGTPGYVRPGGTYRVYANVADPGNPASGTNTVTGNLVALTVGQTTAALAFGGYTVDGTSYNFRGPSLTAGSFLAANTYTYSLTSADNAGNTATQSGFSAVVDNVAPSSAAIDSANKTGNTVGKPEIGDSLTLTYTEPIDPNSIVAGWTGAAATSVVVRIDKSSQQGEFDTLTVYNAANTSALPLGTVDLGRADYVTVNRTFGATATASTMTRSGNALTIVLGTASGATTTAAGTGTMTWNPVTGPTDRAGNAATTTQRAEAGTADKEF
jgi:hypothetical protein